jgi:hypothetical protein
MFPLACCEYSSLVLAWFLCEEHPGVQIEVVTGKLRSDSQQRHVWLSIDGYNIDISADQFDKALPPVLITRSGGWHDSYAEICRESFDATFFDAFEEEERLYLIADYEVLASQARASR